MGKCTHSPWFGGNTGQLDRVLGPHCHVTPLPSTKGYHPPTYRSPVHAWTWTQLLAEVMQGGVLSPQDWPLSRAGLAASADSGTFLGLASGPSYSLKTAAPLGWQPCGRLLTLPGMTPCLCREGWLTSGEAQRLEATLPYPLDQI